MGIGRLDGVGVSGVVDHEPAVEPLDIIQQISEQAPLVQLDAAPTTSVETTQKFVELAAAG